MIIQVKTYLCGYMDDNFHFHLDGVSEKDVQRAINLCDLNTCVELQYVNNAGFKRSCLVTYDTYLPHFWDQLPDAEKRDE